MHEEAFQLIELTHGSPEFDQAYAILSSDIAPEFMETAEFLRNRLRVRDEENSEEQKILLPQGYTLHLIAAVQNGKVLGAIYGHLIADIGPDNQGIGFVTYVAVHRSHRKQGIGTMLLKALKTRVNEDALTRCNKPIIGMVYEIEEAGKEAIKGCVSRLNAACLDVVYYQPAVRSGYGPEQMDLWYQPCGPELSAGTFKLPADLLISIVRNMLVKEYVGPEMKGFDPAGEPYAKFLRSIGKRKKIDFLVRRF
jgi:GNAT superfamily N-acetyltransferase